MTLKIEEIKRPLVSRTVLVKLAISAAFLFWVYIIWSSTTDLNRQMKDVSGQSLAVHNLQVDYKNEVQEWKNVLLRSNDRESLDRNWKTFETQHQKVATASQDIARQYDVRAISMHIQTFAAAHAENFERYKDSKEVLIKSSFNPQQADTAVKGIDRPLLEELESAAVAVQDETKNIEDRLTAKARSQIEQSLLILALIALLVVWMPKW